MLEIFYNLSGYNTTLFISMNDYLNTSALLPAILQAISHMFCISNFAIGYLAACLYFYYKAQNSNNPAEYFASVYYELTRIGTCYAMFGFIFAALKFSVNLPRPFCSLSPHDFKTVADTSLERCLSSFPSAHTGLSLLVAYCLWPYMNKALKILASCTVIAVALSRIALAMHYPADILYSSIITVIIVIIANYVYKLLTKNLITPIKIIISKWLFN